MAQANIIPNPPIQTPFSDPKGNPTWPWIKFFQAIEQVVNSNPAGASIVQRAVVDIGPHSNNGPGDQMKGILDWNSFPIKVINGPGVGKFIQVCSWSYQYKSGSIAYIDIQSQEPGLYYLGNGNDLESVFPNSALCGLVGTISQLWPGLSFGTTAIHPNGVPNAVRGAFAGTTLENIPLYFGSSEGDGDLTTGNGSVRISVLYTIEDLL